MNHDENLKMLGFVVKIVICKIGDDIETINDIYIRTKLRKKFNKMIESLLDTTTMLDDLNKELTGLLIQELPDWDGFETFAEEGEQ